MAHNIQKLDRQQGIKQAWHGLTEITEKIALENCWLSTWDVQPVILDKRGQPTKYAVLECNDVAGLEVGKAYDTETFTPIDNKAFLNLVRDCISGTDHKIVSNGSVRNRGRVFLSLELAGLDEFKAAGRHFSAFLNFGNGHDKSSVLWGNTSNTCTVCDNTFSMNLFSVETGAHSKTDDISVRVRHTANAKAQLPKIADLIDRAVGVQAQFAAALENAAAQPCNEKAARELFAGFVGRDYTADTKALTTFGTNRVNCLTSLFKSGRGNDGVNLADAFSAVTDYFTHESVRGNDTQKQFLASEFEGGNRAKQDFWTVLRNPEELEVTQRRGAALLAAA